MKFRRVVLVLSLAGALSLSYMGVATESASAQAVVTCAPGGENGRYSDEHCTSPNLIGPYGYSGWFHLLLTTFFLTNSATAEGTKAAQTSKLRGTAGGVETEMQCTTVSGEGSIENVEAGKETYFAKATGTISYSGCTVTKPAGKGCVVNGGQVKTKELVITNEGLTNAFKFSPASGTELASVKIESCSISGLNNTFPVTGSFQGSVSGPMITTTHAGVTTQNTLKFAGQKAGLDGALTMSGENGNALVLE